MIKISEIKKQLNLIAARSNFTGRRGVWNRRLQGFIDVLELQFDKNNSSFTLNVGVADTTAYKLCFDKESTEFLEQPMCTVSLRVGDLLDGNDKWWPIDNSVSINDAIEIVKNIILPYYEEMHERAALRQYLLDTKVISKRYPLPMINLAILQALLLERAESQITFDKIMNTPSESWRLRAKEVELRVKTYLGSST